MASTRVIAAAMSSRDPVVRTGKDGFFELWLPRNRRYTLEVRQGDWVAQGALTTFAQSPTCLTELRLSRR